MADPRIENLAKILVQYSTKVKPKDRVGISGGPCADPLLREIYQQVLLAGGYPYMLVNLPGLDYVFFSEANDDQLGHINQFEALIRSEFEAMIGIYSQVNTRGLSNVDPAKQQLRSKAYAPLMQTFLERGAAKELKWCGTMYPTDAYAQDAEMSLQEFEAYVYSTTYADAEDPVGEWQRIHEIQQKLVDWLVGKKQVVAKGSNIDMRLSIEGRTFENADGTHNMPSGEIFTGPVEQSVEGWVRFTYPAVDQGREVEGVELYFEGGKVVKATAEKNEEFLLSQLDTDEGARYLGEWAIGTNQKINRFIKNILFDEKIGGTIHMALGAGYPETGSLNKSAIHWDLICDMREGGQIFVDDQLFYESGEFTL